MKRILSEYCARSAAATLISYNMSGYSSRIDAEDMINVCLFRMNQIEKLLSDQAVVTYLIGA